MASMIESCQEYHKIDNFHNSGNSIELNNTYILDVILRLSK